MEKRGSSSFFYVICFVAFVATSIVVGYFVTRARVNLPEKVATMEKIERYEVMARGKLKSP